MKDEYEIKTQDTQKNPYAVSDENDTKNMNLYDSIMTGLNEAIEDAQSETSILKKSEINELG